MSEFVVNGDMFGRYVRIPTGFSKEMFVYKVVSLIGSNSYCDVPIVYKTEETTHSEIVDVLKVICCGIDETKVIRVALKDCELVPVQREGCCWCIANGVVNKVYIRTDDSEYTFIDARFCPKCGRDLEDAE